MSRLAGNFQSFGGNPGISRTTVAWRSAVALTTSSAGIWAATTFSSILRSGGNSSLTYTGADIAHQSSMSGSMLTLGNREGGATGTIQNLNSTQHDALSSSLNTVNGTLNLQNGAQLALTTASGFQNNGTLAITNGSMLDLTGTGGFNNVSFNSGLGEQSAHREWK